MSRLNEMYGYLKDNDIENAYNLIIESEPDYIDNAEYWNLRGALCLNIEEYEASSRCFKVALDIEPENSDIAYNYAYSLEKIGDLSEAALYYGRAYHFTTDANLKKEIVSLFAEKHTLKKIFATAAYGEKKSFIILSSCGWGDVYQRMHHIARSLAKFGHEVKYIAPNIKMKVDNNILVSDLTSFSRQNKRVVDNVEIYDPITAINSQQDFVDNYTDLVQTLIDSSLNEKKVIITYLPHHVNILDSLKGQFFHIYECVDDHSDLEYAFWGTKYDTIWEQKLMNKADAITTTATSLFLQRTSIECRDNVFMSRNAVNGGDFLFSNEEIPEDLKGIPEPRIVYSGAIYEWFDMDLFYEVVKGNPDKSFVIIGFGKNELFKEKYDNLYFLGAKKHSELKNYLRYMQVGIIPFKANTDIIINCDAIKHYEYIACNLPVITTFMPEAAIGKINTLLVETKDSFNEALTQCLSMDIDRPDIINFLADNSWNERASLLCRIIDNEIGYEEKHDVIKAIGTRLDHLVKTYSSPIFNTLFGVYLNIYDSLGFEQNLEKAYKCQKLKYIERQYLTALLLNNNQSTFWEVVLNSDSINGEVKQEYLYRKEKEDFGYILAMSYYCIGDIIKCLSLAKQLECDNNNSLYFLYIKYMLDNIINFQEIQKIKYKQQNSPLYSFLEEKLEDKRESICLYSNFCTGIRELIQVLKTNNILVTSYCSQEGLANEFIDVENLSVEQMVSLQRNQKLNIVIPYDDKYVEQVRFIAEMGITACYIAVVQETKVQLVFIDEEIMNKVRVKDYLRTITFSKYNAADSNIHALLKNIPDKYKDKYKINVIYGKDVWSLNNIVKVPLLSIVTVSGFATFLYYPKFTYNIEVGHGGLTIKACGLMDKKDKNSGGNPSLFEKVDKVCVASDMSKIVFSSFYAIPENKYEITGLPRNDLLNCSNSRENLEKLLGIRLNDKRVIINMPTFHTFDQINRVEGSAKLNDSFKIYNFDYEQFNDFLKENNMICISKVHHGEELSVSKKVKNRTFEHLYFINNADLEEQGLDLYEVIGAGDILITDYSTIYNDFLFMNKPIIFVNTDIEEYRKERGLALEPYDFWTAGPKVQTQVNLQNELIKCKNDQNYYKVERERLLPVFFESVDTNSVKRTWQVIDNSMTSISK